MTRFLCTGDLHLGAIDSYVDDPRAEEDRMLDQIIEIAREQEVDTILIAGDVFHRPRPAPDVLHVFQRFVSKLAAYGIPAVAIHGNMGHDLVNGDEPTALELFGLEWLRVSRTPELVKTAGDIAVCCLPSTPVHRLVAASGGGDRARINEQVAEALVDVARGLYAQVPDGWPSILLAHWSVSGAALPSGLPTDDLHEPVLDLAALEAIGFDAIVLGHIHKAQLIESTPFTSTTPSFYTGSPMTLNFGEANVEHGVWLIEPGDPSVAPKFVPLDGRRFVTVDVDLADLDRDDLPAANLDETDYIASALAEWFPLTDAIVRIRYRASEEQHRRIDLAALKTLIADAGAHRLYQVAPDIVRATSARAEGVDESLAPLSALDAYVAANELDEPLAEGLRALLGRYLEAVS